MKHQVLGVIYFLLLVPDILIIIIIVVRKILIPRLIQSILQHSIRVDVYQLELSRNWML